MHHSHIHSHSVGSNMHTPVSLKFLMRLPTGVEVELMNVEVKSARVFTDGEVAVSNTHPTIDDG